MDVEEPSCGAQFRAAVQVIQGLPRSGSYRPSYEEMLRFYSYYKQATAGCCQGPRPGFWDPIGRYKWDAWHSLGKMSKEEAMAAYVAEMKKVAQKIIDTVPMDETSKEMFGYFEPLYEVIHDMPRPPESFFKRKGGSQKQTAEPSQDDTGSSPALEHPNDALPKEQQIGQHGPAGGLGLAVPEARQAGTGTSDSEGDVFCDTLEQMEPEQAGQPLALTPNSSIQPGPEPPRPHGAGQGEGRRLEGRSSAGLTAPGSQRDLQPAGGEQDTGSSPELSQGLLVELDTHIAGTIQALQDDMRQVLEHLSQLEALTAAQGDTAEADLGQPLELQAASAWPLAISPRTLRILLFLATWPFLTQWLLRRWQGRKSRGSAEGIASPSHGAAVGRDPSPEEGKPPRTADRHRHSQGLTSTVGTQRDRLPMGIGTWHHPHAPDGIPGDPLAAAHRRICWHRAPGTGLVAGDSHGPYARSPVP
ncbi:acyl-CoA-binding domain-containing protein 4 [Indicator indicator]|uniref:acyl-CoA-binding domain-containing protein 4 n=1 Tax=Indicator indicator TaxID=1002788 RepID=UPI0023DEB27F|nr:acyl-CoA-binding domain-containing protein 4 [Indicator indicator]